MDGVLVRYHRQLCAFISRRDGSRSRVCNCLVNTVLMRNRPAAAGEPPPSGLAVVFLGGLTDGLLALDYLPPLDALLASKGVALVQPLLSSSYKGFGTATLEQDALEIDDLLEWLAGNGGFATTRIVLWGHSTGAQIAVRGGGGGASGAGGARAGGGGACC
jgi:hypothetical protein